MKSYSRLPRVTISIAASVATVLGVAAFLILGCAPKPKIPLEDRTPRNVLECALENQVGFEALACLLNLKLQGEEGKFSGTVEFFYRYPDTFSLYPRTFLGIGGFKAMGEGDSLTIYFPKRNEYYRGSFSDFEESGLWAWGISLDMLLDVILGRSEFAAENGEYSGSTEDLFLYKTEEEGWIREYWVDSKRCRVVRSLWTQKEGDEWYRIEYKDFTTYITTEFRSDTEFRNRDIEIPSEIRVESGANDSARLKFRERKFNSSIPSNRFQINIPADAERVVFGGRKSR
ncbi:MAG: DUF4292 domain-containing protein [Candidatus Zixiibacteriota bacterium]